MEKKKKEAGHLECLNNVLSIQETMLHYLFQENSLDFQTTYQIQIVLDRMFKNLVPFYYENWSSEAPR